MQLRLFACREGSATLWEIDDPTVFNDAGAPVAPFLETHPVDFGPARGYGRLREFVQWLALFGQASVTVTPIADGTTSGPTDGQVPPTPAGPTTSGETRHNSHYPKGS